MSKKIFIADDHSVVIMSLKILIQSQVHQAEIMTASTVKELSETIKQNIFDLYILDINMPNNDWVAMIGNIFSYNTEANILIHSMYYELPFVKRAFALGVNGYVTKTSTLDEIAHSISVLLAGKKYISPALAIEMAQDISNQGGKNLNPFDALSTREFEVSIELLNGSEISEISQRMNIAPNTVSSFKRRIFQKMGIRSVHQLSQIARQFRLKTAS